MKRNESKQGESHNERRKPKGINEMDNKMSDKQPTVKTVATPHYDQLNDLQKRLHELLGEMYHYLLID